jgi:hypothetical protein
LPEKAQEQEGLQISSLTRIIIEIQCTALYGVYVKIESKSAVKIKITYIKIECKSVVKIRIMYVKIECKYVVKIRIMYVKIECKSVVNTRIKLTACVV